MDQIVKVLIVLLGVLVLAMGTFRFGSDVGLWHSRVEVVTVICDRAPDGSTHCESEPLAVR